MKTLEQSIKEIRDRVEATTEGPWEYVYEEPADSFYIRVKDAQFGETILMEFSLSECDVKFTTHSRTDIPKLLRTIDILAEGLEKIRTDNEARGESRDDCPWIKFIIDEAEKEATKTMEGE